MALTDSQPTEDPGGLSVTDTRLIQAGDVVRATDGTPRTGLLAWHLNPIVTGTSGMAYSVAPFAAITSRNGSGVEKVANDAATSVATTAAPGSNSRIDVIWVRCRFPSYTDAGQTTPVFGVTQGTASASPAKPSIPAGALELATATVPSTATATNSGVVITQTFRYTAAAGGTVVVRNAGELSDWTPSAGARAFQIDTGITHTRRGAAWDATPKIAQGSFILTGSLPAGGNLKRGITFPEGLFTQVPHIHITVGNGRITPSIDAITPPTAAGASLSFDNWSPGAVGSPPTVWWTAIGI